MELSDFIADPARRKALAVAAGTIPEYLYQVATGRRQASPRLARLIEQGTDGQVRKESLRPDVWGAQQSQSKYGAEARNG